MNYYTEIKCIYPFNNIKFYFGVSLFILLLACSSYAFVQKQNSDLDMTLYPELIYKTEKMSITRNLFSFETNSNSNSNSNFNFYGKEISTLNDQSIHGQVTCDEWSKKIKYLGTFKAKAETWVLVQNSKLIIDKVKKGEPISDSELIIFDITENNFTTTKEGMTACSFKKVSY
jgi:hypothetical protein